VYKSFQKAKQRGTVQQDGSGLEKRRVGFLRKIRPSTIEREPFKA
jgi:hypothetical protein